MAKDPPNLDLMCALSLPTTIALMTVISIACFAAAGGILIAYQVFGVSVDVPHFGNILSYVGGAFLAGGIALGVMAAWGHGYRASIED